MSGCTWVTYADTEAYWHGALVLAQSLLKAQSRFPLIVLVPESWYDVIHMDDFPDNVIVRACEPIVHKGKQASRPEYKSCLNKLFAWTLLEYEKVGWLDCDLLIIRNIDDLFDIPVDDGEMLAAPGCTCNVFNNPRLPKLPHQCPLQHKSIIYVNTGVFVVRPSKSIFDDLRKCNYDYPLPDQDAFNVYFRGRMRSIDPSYNYMVHLSLAHPDIDTDDLRVIHFTFDKPWLPNVDAILPFSKRWHIIWHDLAETTKRTARSSEAMVI